MEQSPTESGTGIGREWGRPRIRVSAIAPGPIRGKGERRTCSRVEEDKVRMAASVPLGRLGKPEEIAAAAAFLMSPEAASISGECLTVDGARWLNHDLFQASSSAK
ncbi:SDR family oxidoreductase [Alicyclobacillus kakegawensis]|uniref:SDR family oxidoreductase n=1 Tax=Alicyclobacillus kakegawensis TaxID=392012 RepID=UPI0009F9A0DB|nr:SDR family oxidoreductase [Alicyclobacillus kakegawensis]